MASSSSGKKPGPKQTLTFVSLPMEIQREIIQHCSTNDLVCLSLVSKSFRHLAATELYREYRIVFPDDDNVTYNAGNSIDSLAGGLDTFVTSDYNYAQHLRSISLDTLRVGSKAEDAYSSYLTNLSCGKFMNTLLLLTLRRARALETFNWNIRVELSHPVYKELHRIKALSRLHLRLQAGPSQYETPPPLPNTLSHSTPTIHPAHIVSIPSLPPPIPNFITPPPPPPPGLFIQPVVLSPPPLQKPHRARAPKKSSSSKEFPTLSGFSNLKSLAVLDIDSLDIIPELQSCVNNSAPTLSTLKLSFSTSLASRARKPPDRHDSSDSEVDDEYQPVPVHTNGASASVKALRALQEKKVQETVLGKIFGLDYSFDETARKSTRKKDEKEESGEGQRKTRIKSDQDFVEFMKSVTTRFMGELNGTSDVTIPQEISDMIGAAAQKYIEEMKGKQAKQDETVSGSNSPSGTSPSSGKTATEEPAEAGKPAVNHSVGLATAQAGTNPDDINIEEPDDHLSIHSEDPQADSPASEHTSSPSASSDSPVTSPAQPKADDERNLAAQTEASAAFKACASHLEGFEAQFNKMAEKIQQLKANESSLDLTQLKQTTSQFLDLVKSAQDVHDQLAMHQDQMSSLKDTSSPSPASEPNKSQSHRHMSDYVRETRGIALEYLAICLIPTKPSALSRAVDLHTLRRITLLNVGNQAPIWSLLHKKHKQSPLALREILTDHVSLVFCQFVSDLPALHELFMLERDARHRPESFAPKTNVGIEKIRRLVLKPHVGTLRRLMVKNLADTRWDLNDKTVLLLCRQGRRLEELACSISIQAMHTLMQHIAGLIRLRALLIVHLRNDDTCVWVMRETKRFLIDNVSHYPHLKLEYVSIDEDDRVDRLRRVVPKKKKKESGDDGEGKDKKEEGKKKNKAAEAAQKLASFEALGGEAGDGGEVDVSAVVAAGMAELYSGGESEEDDDEDDDDDEDEDEEWDGDSYYTDGEGVGNGSSSGSGKLHPGQKIETIEGLQFCDVDEGVRIFQKEIVAGRL